MRRHPLGSVIWLSGRATQASIGSTVINGAVVGLRPRGPWCIQTVAPHLRFSLPGCTSGCMPLAGRPNRRRHEHHPFTPPAADHGAGAGHAGGSAAGPCADERAAGEPVAGLQLLAVPLHQRSESKQAKVCADALPCRFAGGQPAPAPSAALAGWRSDNFEQMPPGFHALMVDRFAWPPGKVDGRRAGRQPAQSL